jgi:hypothetical protein
MPAEPPVAEPPPPVVAQEEPSAQPSAEVPEEPAPAAEEPHLSDAGERRAFNAARQHNASVGDTPLADDSPGVLHRD